MSSITFQSRSFGRDPMDAYAEKQSRERRQEQQRVQNSPLPEFPRRWADPEPAPAWSKARERAEALFSGKAVETEAQSAARIAAEALFARL
jgi:hypothetical protein